MRKWYPLRRNPQIKALQPVYKDVEKTRADVIDRVVYATQVSSTMCPIPITAYAGEKDNIVKSTSSITPFKRRGLVDGDHFSILHFDKPGYMNYAVLRTHLTSFVSINYADTYLPLPATSEPSQTDSAIVGAIPHEPPSFIVRAPAQQLNTAFSSRNVPAVCVITGMRGVGKTQLAAAFARAEIARGCPFVGWVNADSREEMLSGLSRVARKLEIDESEGDSLTTALLLREHLESRAVDCLLVFDNAGVEPRYIQDVIPATGTARIIVTTTDQAYSGLGVYIDVEGFSRDESVAYLRKRTKIDDEAGASSLAQELSDLPLALAQAASTIVGQRLSYAAYQQRLNDVPVATLLGPRARLEYPLGVASAFLLAIESARAGDPAGDLERTLQVIATLSPEGIPRKILYSMLDEDGTPVTEAHVDEVLESCVGSSLLLWSEGGDLVIMHRLIGRVLREAMARSGKLTGMLSSAVDLLEAHIFPERRAWAEREFGGHLASQIEAAWDAAQGQLGGDDQAKTVVDQILQLRFWSVRQLWKAADLTLAVRLGERVLADCARARGDEDLQTLTACFNLAVAYESSGSLDKAITLLERVAEKRKERIGDVHADTLAAEHQLAAAHRSAGHIHEAMKLFELVLPKRQQLFGALHPDTISTQIDLAGTYESVGRLGDAIPLFEVGLRDRVAVLGDRDSHTLSARKHLAGAYESAGRFKDAIELFEQTLADRQSVLGVDHPHTLISWNDLAHAYEADGRLDDAELLYKQNVDDRVRALGHDHPDTISSFNDLAYVEFLLSNLGSAERICSEAASRAEHILGPDHPNTVNLMSTSAWCLLGRNAVDEATDRFREVLASRERMLSEDYPDTIASTHDLGVAEFMSGNRGGAFDLLQRAQYRFERILGADHPITNTVTNNLAILTSFPWSRKPIWSDISSGVKIPRWRPGRRIVKRPLD